MPRRMPSVGFIATVRTRFSPRCCSDLADDVDDVARVARVGHDPDGVVNLRQVTARELHVDHGADDLDDLADFRFNRCCCHNTCRADRQVRRTLPGLTTRPTKPVRPTRLR
jgi:hypothetical protein